MDNASQSYKTIETTFGKDVLAMSWNIATEPALYRQLASNPYSAKAQQIILERFPGVDKVNVIRAVILAEPEGKYDRDFRQLPKGQQEKELCREKNHLPKVNKRLIQYYSKHAKEFNKLSKESVYVSLSADVFASNDVKEIEERYSQNQRRDLRLSIIDVIEVRHGKSTRRGLLPKIVLAALSLSLLFFLALRQIRYITQSAEIKKQVLAVEAQNEDRALPVRLIIPGINIVASIEYVGLTSSGEMGVPGNITDVGWFDLGPRPGERGSAVIDGHVDGGNGGKGVFIDLDKLKEGDKLYIEDSRGAITSFVVRESRTYDPGYTEEVFNSTDGVHLNLITCNGIWNKTKKSYSKRLVVFADIQE